MRPYPRVDDLLRPLLGVPMPRAGRLYASRGTVHVVARCNNREFYVTTPADTDPRGDARGPRWTTQRPVGSPAKLRRYIPHGGDEELFPRLHRSKYMEAERPPATFGRQTYAKRN